MCKNIDNTLFYDKPIHHEQITKESANARAVYGELLAAQILNLIENENR